MPTVTAGASQTITIAAGEAYRVSVSDGGDAYVDLLSGAPGSPYASPRLRAPKTEEVFGPYPAQAVIQIRSISGSASYAPYTAPKPVISTAGGLDPAGMVATGSFRYGSEFIAFGDSIAFQNGGPNIGGGANTYDKGWITWASAALGARLINVRNAGISGDTTAMMLARLEADVTPYASGVRMCIFNGGVNDPTGGSGSAQTFAQTKANLTAIINRLRELFPLVVWCTPTPYALNATVAAQIAQIAAWVRQVAPTLPGVVLCDNYAATINKTATTGDMVTGYSSDSPQLHPNAVGARKMGAELAAVLAPFLSASPSPSPVSQANTVANLTAVYATQVLANPLLVNNGGTITGTNVTSAGAGGLAGAPSGFTVRAGVGASYSDGKIAATAQLVARADGYGNSLRVTVSNGATPSGGAERPTVQILSDELSTLVSGGQTIQGVFTLSQTSAVNVQKISLYMSVTDAGGSRTMSALNNDGAAYTLDDFGNFVFKTAPTLLAGPITGLRFRADIAFLSNAGSGVFDFGRLGVNIVQPTT